MRYSLSVLFFMTSVCHSMEYDLNSYLLDRIEYTEKSIEFNEDNGRNEQWMWYLQGKLDAYQETYKILHEIH